MNTRKRGVWALIVAALAFVLPLSMGSAAQAAPAAPAKVAAPAAPAAAMAFGSTPWLGSWVHSKTSMNYVYVVDDTGANWPVTDAMNIWNSYFAANNMNVRFAKPYSGVCVDANGPLPRCFHILEDWETNYYPELGTTYYNREWGGQDRSNYADSGSGGGNGDFDGAYLGRFKCNHIALHNHNMILTSAYRVARENIIIHELGHSLGLAHNNDTRSVMYPSADNSTYYSANAQVRTPFAGDILSLNYMYKEV